MTFLTVLGVASLLGAVFGFLAARRPFPTWSPFNKVLLGTFLLELVVLLLLSSFHFNVLLLVVGVFPACLLLAFCITEYSRDPRYPDYPEE